MNQQLFCKFNRKLCDSFGKSYFYETQCITFVLSLFKLNCHYIFLWCSCVFLLLLPVFRKEKKNCNKTKHCINLSETTKTYGK